MAAAQRGRGSVCNVHLLAQGSMHAGYPAGKVPRAADMLSRPPQCSPEQIPGPQACPQKEALPRQGAAQLV